MSDFLLEIGLEEVPARMIAGAEAELGRRVHDLLSRERLLEDGATVKTYSTPRRLAVLVEGVRAAQADVEEKLTGPSWKVAFKDGAPTTAAEAFAKKAGVDGCGARKSDDGEGRVCGRDDEAPGRGRSAGAVRRFAEGSAGDLLGEEYVLARGQAGAVCAAGALGCGAARIPRLCRWRLRESQRGMRAAGIASCMAKRR